jgi:hypothetical protein
MSDTQPFPGSQVTEPGAPTPSKDRGPKSQTSPPVVTIFGAGIAGLSAAHELIDRGFDVQVVEPAVSPDEEYAAEVGGLARNQFGRVNESPEILHRKGSGELDKHIETVRTIRSRKMQPVQRRFPVPAQIVFRRALKDTNDDDTTNPGATFDLELGLEDDWGVKNEQKLVAVWETFKAAYRTYRDDLIRADTAKDTNRLLYQSHLPIDWFCREILFVEIRGHTDRDQPEAANRRESDTWASTVREHLRTLNGVNNPFIPAGDFGHHFRAVGVGSLEPIGELRDEDCRRRSNRVEFRIVEQVVPGEHGYRFFPAFYRHLFDTMQRTPILDEQNRESGSTAYDRLVATEHVGLALEDGLESPLLETRPVRSLEGLRKHSELFFGRLGMTYRDVARFNVRLLKYLTSCSERRQREYQNQSWWTFLGGDSERGYSPRMAKYLLETPQALVAMNAKETDARSQGNIVSQLLLHYVENEFDKTLNGPTTRVWLREWKRYLERQGVRFFVGKLGKLEWLDDELIPLTIDESGWLRPKTKRADQHAPSAVAQAIPGVEPTTEEVKIEVLEAERGDYVVMVDDRTFCVTVPIRPPDGGPSGSGDDAELPTCETLASKIAEAVSVDTVVEATAAGTRITIKKRSGKTPVGTGDQAGVGAGDEAPETGDDDKAPSILIQVSNVSGNLGVLSKPQHEEPKHRYRAHDEKRSSSCPDFYILAVSLEEASKLVSRAESRRPGQLDGCLAELLAFDRQTSRRSRTGIALRVHRDDHGRPPADYPMRDFSGVQYYFRSQVRLGKGHNYYPDADWGLSSISQFAYWRERMSPTGAFMGQLSVDIGNFYAPAPPRRSGRFRRSGWNSTAEEIVTEVWNQVQQGLERELAGILTQPDYIHLDEWLRFDDPRGTTFRDAASILVMGGSPRTYTVWVNGQPFQITQDAKSQVIGEALQAQINAAPSGGLAADCTFGLLKKAQQPVDVAASIDSLDGLAASAAGPLREAYLPALRFIAAATLGELSELEALENSLPNHPGRERIRAEIAKRKDVLERWQEHEAGNESVHVLSVRSTVQPETALVFVTGGDRGRYELVLGDGPPLRFAATASGGTPEQQCTEIRDGLFALLVRDSTVPVTPELSRTAGILLVPKGGHQLPAIKVHNDHQNLRVVFGPTLHVRLEQSDDRLRFKSFANATVGYNDAPFLINVPKQWPYRPGRRDLAEKISVDERVAERGLAQHIHYRIAKRRWIAAGTYMATTTRLTTMEAANESARHAVNAILHRLVARAGGDYNAQGKMFADWATIWDPEKNELDELEPLKCLDEKLVAEGLPHVLDVLKVIDAVDALPMHGQPSDDPIANVLQVLQHAFNEGERNWGFSKDILHGMLGQAASQARGHLDPLGVLAALKGTPGDLAERFRRAVSSFMNDPGRPSNQGGAGSGT